MTNHFMFQCTQTDCSSMYPKFCWYIFSHMASYDGNTNRHKGQKIPIAHINMLIIIHFTYIYVQQKFGIGQWSFSPT